MSCQLTIKVSRASHRYLRYSKAGAAATPKPVIPPKEVDPVSCRFSAQCTLSLLQHELDDVAGAWRTVRRAKETADSGKQAMELYSC